MIEWEGRFEAVVVLVEEAWVIWEEVLPDKLNKVPVQSCHSAVIDVDT